MTDKGNNRTLGWDERDYKLWSEIRSLPSYGLISGLDPMISLDAVCKVLEKHAEERFNHAHANS